MASRRERPLRPSSFKFTREGSEGEVLASVKLGALRLFNFVREKGGGHRGLGGGLKVHARLHVYSIMIVRNIIDFIV